MQRILVVEAVEDVRSGIRDALEAWYELVLCANAREAFEHLGTHHFHLILLEPFLHGTTGFDILTWVRNQPKHMHVPVIFLSHQDDSIHKVRAFSAGADDYVVKPFDPMELLARVRVRISSRHQTPEAQVFFKGAIRFDLGSLKAMADGPDGGRDLDLTPIEFRLLYFLARNEGSIQGREEIKREIWRDSVHVTEASIYTHVSSIRRKLGQYRNYLRSVPNVGYIFNSTVKEED